MSLAVGFIPIAGPLLSCVIDGTFVDMWDAIKSGNWAMLGMCALAFVPGVGGVGKFASHADDVGKLAKGLRPGRYSRYVSEREGNDILKSIKNGKGVIKSGSREGTYLVPPGAPRTTSAALAKEMHGLPGTKVARVDFTIENIGDLRTVPGKGFSPWPQVCVSPEDTIVATHIEVFPLGR